MKFTQTQFEQVSQPILVFFDGPCATCQRAVRFLLRRSQRNRFRFVALETLKGTAWEIAFRQQLGLDLSSSIVIWKNGQMLARSAALFAIFAELGWPWMLLCLFKLIPVRALDSLYDIFARNRYDWFGRQEFAGFCRPLPKPQRDLILSAAPEGLPIFSPKKNVFLSAQWQKLIFINYVVPRELLEPFLPAGLELDTWQGECLVSIVAFAFCRTSVLGMSLPICADFEELNLRFYVRRTVIEDGRAEVRRAVVFIKEIVPFASIAQVANAFYGERYQKLPMNMVLRETADTSHVSFRCQTADPITVWMDVAGTPEALEPGSASEFISEHYFGYASRRDKKTLEYQVEHPRWRIWNPIAYGIDGPWQKLYPAALAGKMLQPHSAFLAEGSAVRIMWGGVIP